MKKRSHPTHHGKLFRQSRPKPIVLLLAGVLFSAPAAFAADEICASCGGQVSVSDNFAHHKEAPTLTVEGAGDRGDAYREDVDGPSFTVTIVHLPAGKYTITIGAAETAANGPAERVFDVTAGDTVLAKDFDIFAAAGGPRKAATIHGTVEHVDDALRGPLKVRADDLIRRMSLAEKVAQLQNAAPAVPRLGLPAYAYWNEALHGVSNNGVATVFPEPVGAASSWNPSLFRREGTVIGVEGRAKHNDYVAAHNGDSKSMLQGNYHGSASHPVSILEGIKQLAGPDAEVTFTLGSPITTRPGTAPWSGQDNTTARPLPELSAVALKNASDADLIVYVGDITPAQEGEGFDRDAIELPDVQEELVKALQATGKPMVMVNCSGSAVALPWEAEHLPAILQAWYPGEAGGQAVAEVLFGAVNPSGHLPVTFYRGTADLPAFTDYSMANRTYRYFSGKPLYAFGHGLSYTTFEFQGGKLGAKKVTPRGSAKITFTLANTGRRGGDEVAQVYYRHRNSKVPQPKLALCGFRRVSVRSGKAVQVTIDIPAERMRYWDPAKKQYVVEPGDYEFLIGAASDDIRLTLPVAVASR